VWWPEPEKWHVLGVDMLRKTRGGSKKESISGKFPADSAGLGGTAEAVLSKIRYFKKFLSHEEGIDMPR
jgi:hypothetical protein